MEAPVRLNLTVEQLLEAIRSLPKQAQIVIQRAIEEGLDKDEVRRKAREAIELIRAANRAFSESEGDCSGRRPRRLIPRAGDGAASVDA